MNNVFAISALGYKANIYITGVYFHSFTLIHYLIHCARHCTGAQKYKDELDMIPGLKTV